MSATQQFILEKKEKKCMLKLIVSFICAVEDNMNEECIPGNKPTAVCLESGSVEKLQDTDCESSDVAGSSAAAVSVSEPSDASTANVNAELETNVSQPSMPQPTVFNSSEQCSAAEIQPEVVNTGKKPNVASKKKSQKLKVSEADKMSAEGTWEVSSSDDSSRKNVVLIRRQHLSAIPDSGNIPDSELPEPTQSRVSCETADGIVDRTVPCETAEGNTMPEQVDAVSCEPIEDTVNTEATNNDCYKTDTPTGDALTDNVDAALSTGVEDITQSQSKKRCRKVVVNREPSRKSQRCSARRREAERSVVNAAAAETRPVGYCEDAATDVDKNDSCLVLEKVEVCQEQVVSLQLGDNVSDKTEPATSSSSVSTSVISQTEVSMTSAVLDSSNITFCVDNAVQPVASVALIENLDAASESSAKSESSKPLDSCSVVDSSQGQTPYSHICSSSNVPPISPIKIKSKLHFEQCQSQIDVVSYEAIKVENVVTANWESDATDSSVGVKVENTTVKRESDITSFTYLASDFNGSNCLSDETSLLNTCLTPTFLETLVSPEDRLSHGSVVHLKAVAGTDKENMKITETPSNAASVNTQEKREGELEEVCKSVLEEIVTSVVKETHKTSVSKENAKLSSTESFQHPSQNTTTLNESDSTSEEVPLKKRRSRHVFVDCQSSEVAAPSQQSDKDQHGGTSSHHRRKISSSSSRRHSHRSKKYVGAHTSIVGKLIVKYQS